jgi:hypothetical protein
VNRRKRAEDELNLIPIVTPVAAGDRRDVRDARESNSGIGFETRGKVPRLSFCVQR